ncbi:hypothetical protein ACFO9Q_21615 [Paenibacillus sp. GCM10023252]|uniref:hypothetical protein n=1 Tax=Paenibacillus sp. GCM10023252 TaxID=3252649 RepID=UPI0036083079
MTNQNVFNNENTPLYVQSTSSYLSPEVVSPPEGSAARNGRLFMTTSASTSVGAGSSLLVQITNPSASGRTLYISRISGGVSAAATFNLYSGGTVSGGTTPTPFNTQLGSSVTSIATARVATGSVTGSPTVFTTVIVAAGMFTFDFTGAIIVPETRVLTFSIGTGSLTAAANITWWEA